MATVVHLNWRQQAQFRSAAVVQLTATVSSFNAESVDHVFTHRKVSNLYVRNKGSLS